MKKVLYSSTALAAAAAIAMIPTGDAVAAEKAKKIQLGFGGGMTMLVGAGTQSDSFKKSSNADVAGVTNYQTFNTFASSEIEVKGSVKLDSGITVSVEVEFETDQVTANTGANSIDHSFMKIAGGFGTVYIGSTTTLTGLLSQQAPWTGALNPGVDDVFWVVRPAANQAASNGKIGTNNAATDPETIQYMSPQFAGLRFGTYFMPSSTSAASDTVGSIGGNSGTSSSEFGAILNYENKFGSTDVKGSVGRWMTRGTAANSLNHTNFGARLVFGDISVGGSYYTVRHEDSGLQGTSSSSETTSYNMGVLFKPKGYSVGLHYVNRDAPEDSAVAGSDSKTSITLGATYDLGPGVSAKGSVAYVDYDDELSLASNNNKGWAVVAGIAVSF